MRTLIVIAALTAATVANAQGYRTTIQRYGNGYVVSTYRTDPAPSVIHVPKPTDADDRASAERFARWQDRCKPVAGAPDRNGIRRYVYAAPNCDTGE